MYDLLIRDGIIVDGTGAKSYQSDIGIKDDKIIKIGSIKTEDSICTIDGKGLIVAPGFIDTHSHSDIDVLNSPFEPNKVRQGITTEIAGHCGFSLFPILKDKINNFQTILAAYNKKYDLDWFDAKDFFDKVQGKGLGFNYVPLAGHGIIRVNTVGFAARKSSDEELNKMKYLVEQAMEQGAFGISTGLGYLPGCFADTYEIIELCKVVAKYDGIYATHMRDQGDFLIESVKEAIEIGEESGVSVDISHIKASGRKNWGKIKEALKLIDDARSRGVRIICDFYPYTCASSTLSYELPSWLNEGGMPKFIERIKEKEIRSKVIEEMESKGNVLWDKVLVCEVKSVKNKHLEGRSISEIADLLGKNPYDTVFDLIIEEGGAVNVVSEIMCEEDVREVAKYPYALLGSDAYAIPETYKDFKGHPRNYGAFPRFLSEFVVKEKLISLEDAVKRMTSMPAEFYGISDRGCIKEGKYADITIFDVEKTCDTATYKDPAQYPEGIEYVIINGKIQVEGGNHKKVPAGRVLIHK